MTVRFFTGTPAVNNRRDKSKREGAKIIIKIYDFLLRYRNAEIDQISRSIFSFYLQTVLSLTWIVNCLCEIALGSRISMKVKKMIKLLEAFDLARIRTQPRKWGTYMYLVCLTNRGTSPGLWVSDDLQRCCITVISNPLKREVFVVNMTHGILFFRYPCKVFKFDALEPRSSENVSPHGNGKLTKSKETPD